MENRTTIEISNELNKKLEKLATNHNTDIDNVIKLSLIKNDGIKNPEGYLTESKVSKSKNGKSKSYTYSTVLPKPIVNKFGLDKGRKLYWDIKESNIIITPELQPQPTIEEESIKAGNDILQEMLINGNNNYQECYTRLNETLNLNTDDNTKIDKILEFYKEDKEKYGLELSQVILYLLDYPTDPETHEVLKEVYKEIKSE